MEEVTVDSCKLSVIVANYEQPITLNWFLASLECQDYEDSWEVLVCDDGSSKDILSIVKKIVSRGLNIRYIWQPDRGFRLTHSWNNGIRLAKGDILVILDGDMVVKPDFLSQHAKAHSGHPQIVCGSRAWIKIDEPSSVEEDVNIKSLIAEFEREKLLIDRDNQRIWSKSSLPWMACFSCNISLPRTPEAYFDEQIQGWGTDDWELACRLSYRHGYNIVYREDIEGFHVEFKSLKNVYNVFRRNRHEEILQNIKNLLYLRSKYPEVDMTPAMYGLLRCQIDKDNKWSIIPRKEVRHSLDEAIARAEEWLKNNPS